MMKVLTSPLEEFFGLVADAFERRHVDFFGCPERKRDMWCEKHRPLGLWDALGH
jgi:hypothetical protein